ncbi:putative ribosome bioproteinsis GTPase RsgA-like isoform 3 [Hibiscus syriacus]|uniref:Ribosome bioproteinsis GTPase RsgA-like isoform 3 n=1 Tax=Hibiscus syriacus TaxID=106335 RepID=A0A6A2WSM7_HIBSY|nr:putative ribosome bioproteinsis GTPase RsgA-like isoform 3 [Hibiscus syriacus]
MTGFEGGSKRTKGSNDCLTSLDNGYKFEGIPLLPDLPDDVAKYCLALVPRSSFPAMGGICKTWRSFIQSKEFDRRWEVFDRLGHKRQLVPPMPGPVKMAFGVTVVKGKLLCIAGYSVINGVASASPDVYHYDPFLNRWSKLADLNVARADFACTEVNGMVYVVGGYGVEGEGLSTVEVYRYRSSFTIENSRFVNVYDPKKRRWCEMKKSGCVIVTTRGGGEEALLHRVGEPVEGGNIRPG